jgi:hypothetical protein
MRSAAARAELPSVCLKHDAIFVQFRDPETGRHSSGCPVCVEKIRNDVRKLRAGFRAGHRSRGFRCVTDDTGKRRRA